MPEKINKYFQSTGATPRTMQAWSLPAHGAQRPEWQPCENHRRQSLGRLGPFLGPLLLAIFLVTGVAPDARATRQCLETETKCNPDLLCTFKAQWHAMSLMYVIYAVSDPHKKGQKKAPADGLYFEGTFYDEAVREAKAKFPDKKGHDLATEAGQIFEERAGKIGNQLYEPPECEFGGKPTEYYLPPSIFEGMSTDTDCNVVVNYDKRTYPVDEFGKQANGICEEFLQAGFVHEQVHRKVCLKEKKLTKKPSMAIDNLIREESQAYDIQRRILEAQYKLLSIRCSDHPKDPKEQKRRLQNLTNLLSGYESRLK